MQGVILVWNQALYGPWSGRTQPVCGARYVTHDSAHSRHRAGELFGMLPAMVPSWLISSGSLLTEWKKWKFESCRSSSSNTPQYQNFSCWCLQKCEMTRKCFRLCLRDALLTSSAERQFKIMPKNKLTPQRHWALPNQKDLTSAERMIVSGSQTGWPLILLSSVSLEHQF